MDRLAEQAQAVTLTAQGVVVQRIRQAKWGDYPQHRPVRRIGTYKYAPNRVAGHPHWPRGAPPVLLMTESRLELSWLRWREFQPDTVAMLTQPMVLVWPVGDRCLYRVPDLLVSTPGGHQTVVDVKPDDPEMRTPWVVAMLELTRRTVELAGWRAEVVGSMPPVWAANLRAIAGERRTPHELAGDLSHLRHARPHSVGWALDLAHDDNDGMRCLLHLLSRGEIMIDLCRPILLGTQLTWATSSGH